MGNAYSTLDSVFTTHIPNMFLVTFADKKEPFFVTFFFSGNQDPSHDLKRLSRDILSDKEVANKVSRVKNVSSNLDLNDIKRWIASSRAAPLMSQFLAWANHYHSFGGTQFVYMVSDGPPIHSILLSDLLANKTASFKLGEIVLQVLTLIASLAKRGVVLNAMIANQIYIQLDGKTSSVFRILQDGKVKTLRLNLQHRIFVAGLQNMTAKGFDNWYAETQDCGLMQERGRGGPILRMCNEFNPLRDAVVFLCDLLKRVGRERQKVFRERQKIEVILGRRGCNAKDVKRGAYDNTNRFSQFNTLRTMISLAMEWAQEEQ